MVASGQKANSSSINAITPDLLSQDTDDDFSATGGTVVGNTYATPTSSCSVTITSAGTVALVFFDAIINSGTSGQHARGSIAVTGNTTQTASTTESTQAFLDNSSTSPLKSMSCALIPITPGVNTYTMQFRNATVGGNAVVSSQHMIVIAP